MKKIFTLLVAFFALTSVFAQSGRRDGNYGNGYSTYDRGSYNQPYRSADNYNNYNSYDNRGSHQGYGGSSYDRHRQEDMDRINREYDNRINDYRRDRSLNNYERERRIYSMQRERNEKLKLIGGGLIVGGILALIAGSH